MLARPGHAIGAHFLIDCQIFLMKLLYNPIFLNHDTGMHPENRKRLECLGDLEETNIIDGSPFLTLVHTPDYLQAVRRACEQGDYLDPDTMTSSQSYQIAIDAVGATIMAADSGDFAVIRPPGHHAYPTHASGFCLLNNVAIAAQKLANEGKKVLVLDFDGHLGDGTFNYFYNQDQVLYISMHQYPAFPGMGKADEIGAGKGKGFTVSIPLPPGSGDDIFERTYDIFLPVARQFNPDVVAVSAGFDAHQYDPLLNLRLSVNSYYDLGKLLRSEFKTIFAALEGGYNIKELPKCLFNFVDGVNGTPQRFTEKRTDSEILIIEEYEIRESVIQSYLSKFWSF